MNGIRLRLFSKIGIKLAVGFIALLIMMASLALYSTMASRRALADSVGLASEAIVRSLADTMDKIIYLKSHEIITIIGDYQITKEVSDSNSAFDAMVDPEEYINQIDENWTSAPLDVIPEYMRAILESNVSIMIKTQFVEHYLSAHGIAIIGEIIITNKYGALIAATDRTTDFRQNDETWWQSAQESELLISDISYDESSDIYGVSACAPILDDYGEVIGIAKAVINVLSAAKDIELTALGYETSELKITTQEGLLIFSSRAYVIFQNVSSFAFFERVTDERGYFSEKEGSVDRLFSYATSTGYLEYEGYGWLVFLSHSEDEVLGPATELQTRILIVAILTIALGAVLSAVLSRSITRPIAALEAVTRSMAKGELDQRIAIVREDELGRLAESFNTMASELELLYSDLDERVRERTKDLKNVNAKLGVLASITRHDALNQMTIQKGLLGMAMESSKDPVLNGYLQRLDAATDNLVAFMKFTSEYGEVGINKPEWVYLQETLVSAIAGLDLAGKELNKRLEGVEVFADPMFPKVLHNLITNSLKHGKTNTAISLSYSEGSEGLTIVMEDNGVGVPTERKEAIFLRERTVSGHSHGLFLSAEILKITNISIRETGIAGRGARFEIFVPKGKYRFVHGPR
ncbi:MAG: HAMP domain-containing protein [Thermoplasmata archaeon]|nr:HAMP domain-containing protein [Thermoplasmata archaeon]TFG71047.1 MAG: HAMP domain-containing protein [Methanomassiliicoccus sp.]